MKMFKKLMAIALAGVMALAVLTGCGSSLNEKEIIKQMNDQLKELMGYTGVAALDLFDATVLWYHGRPLK